MNDRYLFRAKRIDDRRWVEGCLLIDYVSGQYFIHANGNSVNESDKVGEDGCLRFVAFDVDPSTICQCTGRRDEDNKLIFENDIVIFLDCTSTENGYSERGCVGEVLWDDETLSFQVTGRLSAESYEVLGDSDCRVIGNIFDNMELLEIE